MAIQEIIQKEDWKPSTSEFLQSWEWGEFQATVGNRPIRVSVGGLMIQGFVHSLPLGMAYVYWPRISIIEYRMLGKNISNFLEKKLVFFRIESIERPDIPHSIFYIQNRQPQHTLILDLAKSEDELLADMHSKTRYNIRLAEKKGVEIREEKNREWFWKLNEETTQRDGFKSHGKVYYETMLELPIVHQLTAFFEDKPIASQIYIGWNGRCTYLHGASSNEYRNLMAPYLLQWESIKIAKKFGNTEYDLWGVAAPKEHGKRFHNYSWDETDKLSTVTRYKAGFGGTVKSYPDAFEIPLRPALYRLFQLAKRVL
ncbi:MAG: hypothetical protein COV60_01225 [Candidatus Magasanikbacteria bacterium CG11_big_fil_rev_8_21_14_0_20_43_7]|uniref:FemAB family protein n=1 Tax=Candidatus Magasanikbacteria bacterium CG11_big_fil_rev_8_21_14_0_20_43_7 TaxID=1974654 RepID=A0A2H0N599_9BACT|nr:MAG: hypothetical protein COV60_01225 [Candidatus Magasanikbacteria bacterium CG11_big_fil_rev_8_21_14_0_20_43_7]